jgi:hypothetical protein
LALGCSYTVTVTRTDGTPTQLAPAVFHGCGTLWWVETDDPELEVLVFRAEATGRLLLIPRSDLAQAEPIL